MPRNAPLKRPFQYKQRRTLGHIYEVRLTGAKPLLGVVERKPPGWHAVSAWFWRTPGGTGDGLPYRTRDDAATALAAFREAGAAQ